MRKITCHEADELRYGLTYISSCTDLDAKFHSEPTIETTWGCGDTAVLREHRYPARYDPDALFPQPDRKPCEHYDVREEA